MEPLDFIVILASCFHDDRFYDFYRCRAGRMAMMKGFLPLRNRSKLFPRSAARNRSHGKGTYPKPSSTADQERNGIEFSPTSLHASASANLFLFGTSNGAVPYVAVSFKHVKPCCNLTLTLVSADAVTNSASANLFLFGTTNGRPFY